MSLQGLYFDGKSARGVAVDVTCSDDTLLLQNETLTLAIPTAQIELSPRLGRTRRVLQFPDGAVCELDDSPLLDQWFQTQKQQRWNLIAQLEAHWIAVSLSAILIIGLVISAAIWGLPLAAKIIAREIPQTWVDELGRGALASLDKTFGAETTLSTERQQALRKQFQTLADSAHVAAKFEFRTWKAVGANALALPDSTIVMTDELVKLADDDRELLAVIAHELGHEHERHALQQTLASAGIAGLIFILNGDISGLANIAVAAPTLLTHLHHSRELEHEADQFGFALLQKNAIDPVWFARIIRKLSANYACKTKSESSSSLSWLNTHPDSEARAKEAETYGITALPLKNH